MKSKLVRWFKFYPRTYQKRLYSINITPANIQSNAKQNYSVDDSIKHPPQSISQLLHDYQERFPNDKITNSLIDSYERLKKFPQEIIKIGIIYHDETIKSNCRILETILADPLASNNQDWFNKIINRNKQNNLSFTYLQDYDITGNNFSVPSPILSSLTRPSFMIPKTTNITANDLIIYEINNLSSFKFNQCNFFIYITDNITKGIKNLPEPVKDRILLTIIDNSDFTPTSSESTPIPIKNDNTERIIKVNSEISYKGIIDFLLNDTKALNNYLESLVQSNIFQILKIIGYNLPIETLANWNMTKIIDNIKREEINFKELDELYQSLLKHEINNFSASMHFELQKKFIPLTTQYFNKSLKWYKLYWKNDNVEYDLKDYFNNYFMNQTIENYNITRGKMINILQNHKFVNYSRITPSTSVNPLLDLKNDIINTRIHKEIQPVVAKSLIMGLVYYQLPVSIISFMAYQYFDFTMNSTMSIFALGIVMGFNYVSKNWELFTKKWLMELFEEIRIVIDKKCVEDGLIKELAERYDEERTIIKSKRGIIEGINNLNK